MAYIPDEGDIVHLDLSPSAGHEFDGPHFALVVSRSAFSRSTGLAVICPITSRDKDLTRYPMNVPFSAERDAGSQRKGNLVEGQVLCAHLRSIDIKERGFHYNGQKAPRQALGQVRRILKYMII